MAGFYYSKSANQWYADPEGKMPIPESQVPPDKLAKVKPPEPALKHPLYEKYVARPASIGIGGLLGGPQEMADEAKQPLGKRTLNRNIAGYAVGDDPASGAINAALLASGLGPEELTATAIRRVAIPTIAGAVGSKLGGEGATKGAVEGGLTGLGGEMLGGGVGVVGRLLGKDRLLRKTLSGVGETIGQSVPELGALKTDADFSEQLVKGKGVKRLGDALDSVKQRIMDATSEFHPRGAQPKEFMVPTLGKGGALEWERLPFDKADAALSELDRHGYNLSGDPKTAVDGAKYRAAVRQGRDMLADQVNSVARGLGDQYRVAQKKFATGETLQRIFNTKGVFSPEGFIDQPKLADLLGKQSEYYEDLARSMGGPQADAMVDSILRGSRGMARDLSDEPLRMRMGLGGAPHFHPPRTYRPVGNVPAYMNPPRIPLQLILRPGASAITEEMDLGDNQ